MPQGTRAPHPELPEAHLPLDRRVTLLALLIELAPQYAKQRSGMLGALATRGIAHMQRAALILALADVTHSAPMKRVAPTIAALAVAAAGCGGDAASTDTPGPDVPNTAGGACYEHIPQFDPYESVVTAGGPFSHMQARKLREIASAIEAKTETLGDDYAPDVTEAASAVVEEIDGYTIGAAGVAGMGVTATITDLLTICTDAMREETAD